MNEELKVVLNFKGYVLCIIHVHVHYTVTPVLRGHLCDKEIVASYDR